jgi:hypothetical protein
MAKVRMTDLSDLLGAKKAAAAEPAPESEAASEVKVPAPEKTSPTATKKSKPATETSIAPSASTLKAATSKASTNTSTGTADRGSRAPKTETPTPALDPGTPRYLTLMRKEARITPTQADELSRLVRTLNRARHGQGERITDNTLIRVAIGLLMERVDDLRGTTEVELFQSLGLESAE